MLQNSKIWRGGVASKFIDNFIRIDVGGAVQPPAMFFDGRLIIFWLTNI